MRISNKGSGMDIIPYAVLIVFAIALFFPILKVITDSTGNALEDVGIRDDVNHFKPSNMAKFYRTSDIIVPLVFISLTLIAGALAIATRSLPILIIFIVFFAIFGIVFSVLLSNTYEKFTYNTTDNITAAVESMPKTKMFMERFPTFVVISIAIVGTLFMALIAKS